MVSPIRLTLLSRPIFYHHSLGANEKKKKQANDPSKKDKTKNTKQDEVGGCTVDFYAQKAHLGSGVDLRSDCLLCDPPHHCKPTTAAAAASKDKRQKTNKSSAASDKQARPKKGTVAPKKQADRNMYCGEQRSYTSEAAATKTANTNRRYINTFLGGRLQNIYMETRVAVTPLVLQLGPPACHNADYQRMLTQAARERNRVCKARERARTTNKHERNTKGPQCLYQPRKCTSFVGGGGSPKAQRQGMVFVYLSWSYIFYNGDLW